jgi:hypothetical protein
VRRLALSLAAAVALLVVGVTGALALDRFYKGQVEGGGIVEFRAVIHDGTPERVYRFNWANVSCPAGGATSWSGRAFHMQVHNRVFEGSHEILGGNAIGTVTGKFSKDHQTVSGTLQVQGSLSGCEGGDTGLKDWKHTHGP